MTQQTSKQTTEQLEQIAAQVRRDIIRMVSAVSSGHPGGSLGATDTLTALYFEIMSIDPTRFTMDGAGEDMFFLSNGHISPVFYSILAHRGYFPVSELSTFRILGSRLQGHPTPAKHLPGIRLASGSLGQGLSCAIGAAVAKKMNGDPSRVFVMMGDGELEEGQIWEAAIFANAHKVDNLIGIVDMNGQQIDGSCEAVAALGDLRSKWESFGWTVIDMDGHDMAAIVNTLRHTKHNVSGNGSPVVILAHTVMGRGVDFMAGTNEWHGKAPNAEQTQRALAQLPVTLGDY